MSLSSDASAAKNPLPKRTLKIIAPWKNDWKHTFNPKHNRRSELTINLNLLQGSASLDVLKQVLSPDDEIDVEFGPRGVWFKPNFNNCFVTDQADPKEALIKIPQHGAWLLPYGTAWILSLSDQLAYQITVNCEQLPSQH